MAVSEEWIHRDDVEDLISKAKQKEREKWKKSLALLISSKINWEKRYWDLRRRLKNCAEQNKRLIEKLKSKRVK